MATSYHTEIGKLLRNAREDLRLTLTQASGMLHIRAHYLQALESGNLDDLPGAAYTKGYLQAYASFLHLDKDEILRRFELVEDEVPVGGLFFPQVFSKEKNPSGILVGGGLALVVIIYVLWFMLFRPELENISVVIPPPTDIQAMTQAHNIAFNHTCSLPRVELYPPCYQGLFDNEIVHYPFFLPHHRIRSVMELVR